jgi:hypothetical protein
MSNDRLAKLEQIAKIVSTIAVPVVIGIFGWLIQAENAGKSVRQDYVKIATTILSRSSKNPQEQVLRAWAARLLNDNSPTKFSETELIALKSGNALLPAPICQLPSPPASLMQSPPEFRMLSDSPAESDREPAGISLAEIAETLAFNANICHQWRDQALGCRAFYRNLQAALDKKR